jgi:primosomal protein N' (replication factor Y)
VLTAEQTVAVEAIDPTAGFSAHLLHGVTGSGKTEVYLRLIERALAAGKQVLLLVPEINLTPQLEGRVRARFPETGVVSLHSELAEAARERNWRAAFAGEASIVLGTRLSVFTPLPRLGLIVVDEEHDPRSSSRTACATRRAMSRSSRPPAWYSHPARLGDTLAGKLGQCAEQALRNAHAARAGQSGGHACRRSSCIDTRRMVIKDGVSEP